MIDSTEQLKWDLTHSIHLLENIRDRLDYDDPEIRKYARVTARCFKYLRANLAIMVAEQTAGE